MKERMVSQQTDKYNVASTFLWLKLVACHKRYWNYIVVVPFMWHANCDHKKFILWPPKYYKSQKPVFSSCGWKIKLKNMIRHSGGRICLTTDSWTSIQWTNYMYLIAHFIDWDWKLNKIFFDFCPINSHKGNEIGKNIEKCLLE